MRARTHIVPAFVAAFVLLNCLAARAEDLIISEFLANNVSVLRDADGDFSDWIELFNPSANAMTLEGWSLTDDPNTPGKWRFPAISIPGRGFLTVFASGKDRTEPSRELHTNFSLNRAGEYLALIRADGTAAQQFSPSYPPQFQDVSYGREIDLTERRVPFSDTSSRFLIPQDASLDQHWMAPAFDDALWEPLAGSLGYDLTPAPEVEWVLGDASVPADRIHGTSFNSPQGEEVGRAIDGSPGTKYLNFDKLNAGLTVSLARGETVVTGLQLTAANDAPERDPTSFVLSGSIDGVTFTEIARGAIPRFPARFHTVEVAFENTAAYTHYRLIFPTVDDPRAAVAMQIAEVEFMARVVKQAESPLPDDALDVTQPGDLLDPTSFNSPAGEEVQRAIDNHPRTKYLNFDTLNAGFTVTPSSGESVVAGLKLTSANDAPERDPTSFTLEGSNNQIVFEPIASGAIPPFTERFQTVTVPFSNDRAYLHYRLLFPSVRDPNTIAMQIAEVELLGVAAPAIAPLDALIETEVTPPLNGAYLRLPFPWALPASLEAPELHVWAIDGFVAYLNGLEVARANAPPEPVWNSRALTDPLGADALRMETIDLTPFSHALVAGSNVLAVHALNDRPDSQRFFLRVELVAHQVTVGSQDAFFTRPTPSKAGSEGFQGVVSEPVADLGHGFFDSPIQVALTSDTDEAVIRYTLDGSEPTAEHGANYTEPLTLASTTVLRAAAFREEWVPSPVTTQTYLFVSDVLKQSHQGALDAGFPERWNQQTADYGLDPWVRVTAEEMTALPSISLVLEPGDLFGRSGIYANPTQRGSHWERKVSFEWLDPAGNDSFQENAGVRIQGGAFRRFDLSLKKSFRLIFRKRYGPSRLRRSLFGPEAAPEADSIVLRANGNDAWKWGGADALYIRDAFAMESMRAMGNVAPHSTFAHLYINGLYWGLYNPAERPDAAFSSIYHGGEAEDWDALNQDSVPDGNADAWNRLLAQLATGLASNTNYQRLQGNHPDGTRHPDAEVLLDVDNLIDYMILNFYLGNSDWPERNHWYGRQRDGEQGFQFYPWDSETSLGLHSDVNANRINVSGKVARPYAAARTNADFRARFGDRVHHHFYNGGALASDQAAQRFASLANSVDAAIAAESARWGDQLGSTRFTRARHWRAERDHLLANYFPRRSSIVLEQLRGARLYPRVDAPVFNQHGGRVSRGFALTMTASEGRIVYTLDGSDPRSPKKSTTYLGPLILRQPSFVKARAFDGKEWSALVEAHFDVGATGPASPIGFEVDTGSREYILRFPNGVGLSSEVQSSDDLIRWLPLQPLNDIGQEELRIPIENQESRQFFRIRQAPK